MAKWSLPAALALLGACANTRVQLPMVRPFVLHRADEHEAHCARKVMDARSPYRMPLAQPATDAWVVSRLQALPDEARRTARAGGLEALIAGLLEARESGLQHTDETLERRDELILRLMAFDAQLSSLAFETACTRRRVVDLIGALDAREHERQLALAGSSLIVGASTGVTAGALELAGSHGRTPTMLAVGGGLVTALLGAASLLVPERPVALEHRHNLLRPMLLGEDPAHLFPTFVFRMLAAPEQAGASPREQMLRDVDEVLRRRFHRAEGARVLTALTGDGALYGRNLLEARAEVLLLLESAVAGVARELELLHRSLVRVLHASASLRHRHTYERWVG